MSVDWVRPRTALLSPRHNARVMENVDDCMSASCRGPSAEVEDLSDDQFGKAAGDSVDTCD